MFIQLSRVVYLLVLLQCCAGVIHGVAERPEIEVAYEAVERSAAQVSKFAPDVEGCAQLSVEGLTGCVEKCEKAKALRIRVTDLASRIKKIIWPQKKLDEKALERDVDGLVKEAVRVIPEAGEAARDCSVPANKSELRRRMCGVSEGNLAPELHKLEVALDYYKSVKGVTTNPKDSEEFYNTNKMLYDRVVKFRKEAEKRTGDRIKCDRFGVAEWKDTKKGVDELIELIEFHGGRNLNESERNKWETLTGDRAKEREKQMAEDNKVGVVLVPEKVDTGNESESTYMIIGVPKQEGEVKVKDVVRRPRENPKDIQEFKRDLEMAKVEVENAKRLAEEKAKREREERERREREEQERARKAEEERRRAKAEEDARRAEEERVRAAEKEKERQAAEKAREEAIRAAEKAKEEKARKAAEMAKKKKDSSPGPALVQNLLMLLVLMCSVGCTLVC